MEVTQFTYFQQVGGLECHPVSGENTYGIERLAMYIQGSKAFMTLFGPGADGPITYGDVFKQNEVEMSEFNFDCANVDLFVFLL